MMLKNVYWYFKSALDDTFCNQVIEHANSKKDTIAVTGKFGKKKKLSSKDKNVTGTDRTRSPPNLTTEI